MKKGWEIKRLGELCTLMTGGTPSRSKPEYFINGNIKWLVSGDVHKKEIFDCEGRITEEAMKNSNTKFLPVNSVIIALNGQGKTRGAVALLRTKATCNQSLVGIYPKDINAILPEYIFCNLDGRYEEIRRITGDDDKDRRGLNMPLIRNIEIPVPSLPEQQRIVAISDEAFSAIAKAKANTEQNLKNAKELFESYLQRLFKNGDWPQKTLNEISENLDSKRVPITKNVRNEGVIPYYGASGIVDYVADYLFDEDLLCVSEDGANLLARTYPIAFSIAGKTWVNNHAHVLRFKNIVSQKFVELYLNSILLDKFISGMAQPKLNQAMLNKIPIPFPSLKIQEAIVEKSDALTVETKKLESIYQQKIDDLEELKKSILQKAFSGELKTSKAQMA